MFPSKTSRDVGMVDDVSDATGSCMEKPTGEKVQEQGGLFHDSVTTLSTFARACVRACEYMITGCLEE